MAGSAVGTTGSSNGVGTIASFNRPYGVGISSDGSYALVADQRNHQIRKVIMSTSVVSLMAGSAVRTLGSSNGVGTIASFYYPVGVGISSDGSYALVADTYNNQIRKVIMSTSMVSLMAGSAVGTTGSSNGVGTIASFYYPSGVGISSDGSYALVVDHYNNQIRKVIMSTSVVSLMAGSAVSTTGSSNGVGTIASFNNPFKVGISSDGSYALVADRYNNQIRKVIMSTSMVSLMAGSAVGTAGSSNGVGTIASFYNPYGVGISSDGSYALVADSGNHQIRKVIIASESPSPSSSPSESPSCSPSVYPSVVPTTNPSMIPSASPSSSPTSIPSSNPTSPPTRTGSILLCLYDIGNQGWPSDLTLDVSTADGDQSSLSLSCECQCLEVNSWSKDYDVCMKSPATSIPFTPLDVIWSVRSDDTVVYGSTGSCVHVIDGHVNTSSKLISPVLDETCQTYLSPADKLIKVNGVSLDPYRRDLGEGGDPMQPHPPVEMLIRLKNNEVLPASCKPRAMSSNTCEALPAAFTHPHFIITRDAKYSSNEAILSVSSLSFGKDNEKRIPVPFHGDFMFHAKGYVTDSYPSFTLFTWDFCGYEGKLGDTVKFSMRGGKCSFVGAKSYTKCTDPYTELFQLQDSSLNENYSDQEADVKMLVIFGLSFIFVGVLTIGLILSKRSTTEKTHEFSELEMSESVIIDMEPQPVIKTARINL